MKPLLTKQLNTTTKALILGSVGAFALSSAYLFYKRWKRRISDQAISPVGKSNQESLNMERYVFKLFTDHGEVETIVEQAGECYAVHLDGRFAGNMWQDENQNMEWNTHEESLAPYLWDIANKLSEAFSREGYPSLLRGAYNEIIATNWKSSETLEVIVSEDTDIEVFTTFLRDEVLNLVDFEEHLDLIVKRENDAYFVLIGIN